MINEDDNYRRPCVQYEFDISKTIPKIAQLIYFWEVYVRGEGVLNYRCLWLFSPHVFVFQIEKLELDETPPLSVRYFGERERESTWFDHPHLNRTINK